MPCSRAPAPRLVALLVGLLGSLLAGCGGDGRPSTASRASAAAVTYAFHDTSVPPQHHRSFTVELATAAAPPGGGAAGRVVVDAYGDVLHDAEVHVPAAAWAAALDALSTMRSGRSGDGGCSGGTSQDVVVRDAGRAVLELHVARCGSDGAEGSERLRRAVDAMLAASSISEDGRRVDLATLLAPSGE